jgi:hypothetical protein
MPETALLNGSLHEELGAFDKKLHLAETLRDCARLMSDKAIHQSDLSWMASIFVGDLGTALAVTGGQRAGRWASQAHQLDERVSALRRRRDLLELMIALRG